MSECPSRNLGLDLVRATEAAALTAGRWMGLGRAEEADQAAAQAMAQALHAVGIEGDISFGEGTLRDYATLLSNISAGSGLLVDVVLDPIDGRALVAHGCPGAISVMAGAPSGALCSLLPAVYMDKIVVNAQVAEALVPECMDAPAAWTLALAARAKGKQVGNLTVFVLDRPRHADLIEEIRAAGAHVMLRTEGDITGALLAASLQSGVDLLMGVGGVLEGLISACAVKAMGGAMLGRLAPQSEKERAGVRGAGLDVKQIWTGDGLASSDAVFFAATGITDGPLLSGVRYHGNYATSNSMILRGETGTRRIMQTEHVIYRPLGFPKL
jgi:fructose-1,6-bisphosphatase II